MTYKKLYTRKGDSGVTSLFDGTRVSKSDPRVELLCQIDGINIQLGSLHFNLDDSKGITEYQQMFSSMMGEIAKGPEFDAERWIDIINLQIEMTADYLDGVTQSHWVWYGEDKCVSAYLYDAVGISIRNAEIKMVELKVRLELIQLMNALSKLFYLLARKESYVHRNKVS